MSENNSKMRFIILAFFVLAIVSVYAGATNTLPLGGNNSTVVIVHENDSKDSTPVSNQDDSNTGNVAGNNSPVIVNNNYVTVNNSIQVPASVQPSVTPDQTITSDETLKMVETVETKKVSAPKIVEQKTVTVKATPLHTGQLVKISDDIEVKKGLELTDVNAGINVTTKKKTCEYIVITNHNDFDMGLGGYTLFVYETQESFRLPNINIGAGKSVKILTVNGKPDSYNKEGYLVKFHLRLATELYPNSTPVNIYLLEPNFGYGISSITTKV